jgi:hypothetical protein
MAIVYWNYYSKNKSLKELGTLQLSSKDDASVLQGNPKWLILWKYIEPLINWESIVSSIYWDEWELEKDVCNEWVKQAIWNKAGWYENWIWVPATHFVTDWYGIWLDDLFYYREVIYQWTPYVCKWFAVMKFEAKHLNWWCINVVTWDDDYCSNLNWNVWSTPAPLPLTALTQWEAIHACKWLTYWNATSHLITNNEYMTLARNIEQQANNWSSWVVWEWYIYKWNDDWQPWILAVSNINDWYDWTWDWENIQDSWIYNGSTMSSKGQRRTLYLSNWVAIWDLSGNVREHVNKSNVPTTSNNRVANSWWNNETFRTESVCLDPTWDMRQWRNDPPPARKWYRFSFSWDDSELGWTLDWNNDGAYGWTCNWQNWYSYSSFWPGISWLNATNWIWRIWAKWYAHRDHIIMVRWGHRSKKALWWLYSTGLDYSASSKESSVGFRCAL